MKKKSKIFQVLLLILVFLVVLLLFHTLNHYYPNNILNRALNGIKIILTPALIALILTYLVSPFTKFLIDKTRLGKKMAIALTIILVVIVVGGIGFFVVIFIKEQIESLYQTISDGVFVEQVRAWFEQRGWLDIYLKIEEYINNLDFSALVSSSSSILVVALQAVTTIILTPIFLWHFLSSKNQIFNSIITALPDKVEKHVRPIAVESNTMIRAYFKSKVLSMVFLFASFLLFYVILGFPLHYAMLFALLIALLDLIPYLGPFLANVIPIIYVVSVGGSDILYSSRLHVSPIVAIIILLAGNFILQAIQGNIVLPAIASNEMQINSLLILVSMLFFGSLLGVWGIVLSIPLCGVLMIVFRHFRKNKMFIFNDDFEF